MKIPKGLKIDDLEEGKGPAVTKGSRVTLHCTMSLRKGDVVFDTHQKNEPLHFTVGDRRNVSCLEYGVLEMKVGGKRRITSPPAFAYRDIGVLGIPPNAFLIVEVEMLSAEPPLPPKIKNQVTEKR